METARAARDGNSRPERPYADPYLTGVGLGLVLLTAFVVMGRGLGASGAFASAASGVVAATDSVVASRSSYFSMYTTNGESPWTAWLVFEIAGVVIGGLLSAWWAGRLGTRMERGPRVGSRTRVATAFAGGAVMGLGAVLARGCTSGQALTGGALLSVGSWTFVAGAFGAAYAAAWAARRVWT